MNGIIAKNIYQRRVFLYEDTLEQLCDENFINQDVYMKSYVLGYLSIWIIRKRPLHKAYAIRANTIWAKIISLADELLIEVEQYELL